MIKQLDINENNRNAIVYNNHIIFRNSGVFQKLNEIQFYNLDKLIIDNSFKVKAILQFFSPLIVFH